MVALGVVGSPRRGNAALAAADLMAACDPDGSIVTLDGPDAIVPIGDCRVCIDADACTRRDRFDDLMARVEAADLLILATPLYWYGPSAQLKAFLDRWSCRLDRDEKRFRDQMRGTPTALVVAQGERGYYEAAPCLQMLEWTVRYLEMPVATRVVVVGHGRNDYREDAAQRDAVRAVGAQLARGGIAPDLMPPWFHLARDPGTPLGGTYPPPAG